MCCWFFMVSYENSSNSESPAMEFVGNVEVVAGKLFRRFLIGYPDLFFEMQIPL